MGAGTSFEPVPGARHRVELRDAVEWVVIPARRNWVTIPFLTVWLFFWTLGGRAAIGEALSAAGAFERLFLGVWLIGWAIAWVFAAAWLLWQIGGEHRLAVHGSALVHRWRMPLLSRTRRYDAAHVRNLASAEPVVSPMFRGPFLHAQPPFAPMQRGTIKLDYGARTIRLVPGLDEAEGRMIVERLAAKLPRGAVGR